jgi:hypothetical protein
VIVPHGLSANPVEALRELAQGEVELEQLRRDHVRRARGEGISWEQIGEALGMSRQAAWEYFTREARGRIAANAAANTELDEDSAVTLAVSEVKRVRRHRSKR